MNPNVKKISPALFALACLFFLMPFLSLSCNNQTVAIFSGLQLVTGTQIQQQGGGESKNVDPEPVAIVVLVVAISGIAMGFLKGKSSAVLSAIIGAAGFILMFLLKNKIDADVLKEGQGMFQVKYEPGFWLVLAVMIVATVFNGFLIFAKSEPKVTD
jgi:hypothetical protein